MVELIAGANLPPFFVDEYLDGFVAAERAGTVVGCGGIEMYGDCAVVRSVVVAESERGTGLGRRLAEALMADASKAGAVDLYLFTADALPFWAHLGFEEVGFDAWREPARACWQYQFLSQNHDLDFEVHTMWRKA
jgi:N-acetylglutamate synthase-like GNAT family acetyltransferase